jgi:hypothetical protein
MLQDMTCEYHLKWLALPRERERERERESFLLEREAEVLLARGPEPEERATEPRITMETLSGPGWGHLC